MTAMQPDMTSPSQQRVPCNQGDQAMMLVPPST